MQTKFQISRRFKIARSEIFLAILVFLGFALIMLITSPTDGDFSWSDSPRHALNGIFVHDLIAAHPFYAPKEWAVNYYLKYPALTFLFYPPLFSAILAASYKVFGFSHVTAQATVAFFHLLLGFSVYLLARRWVSFGYALGAALMLAAAPEISYWGRQVMLDVPAYAWLGFMAVFFVAYLENERKRDWYLALLFYLLALYTKQTPLFIGGALAVGLILSRGWAMLKCWHLWVGAGLFIVLLLPLVVMQLKFGQVNTASMVGSERADLPRLSIEAWTYYLKVLPRQLGWPTLSFALVYLFGALIKPTWRISRACMGFLLAWFGFGYLMFSLIMVREPRHDLMALLPLPVFAALGLHNLFSGKRSLQLVGAVLAVVLGISSVLWSVYARPVQYIDGYQDAAGYVMEYAPKGSVIMFHGYRDGNFIFNIRSGNRPDLSVARSDKFLIRMAIERTRGVEDRGFTPDEIEQIIQRHGVLYIVAQLGFWNDLPSFAALETLLADQNKFEEVSRIKTRANFDHEDHELTIYRYLGEVQLPPQPMQVEMVGIGQDFIENKR
nr:glycosyltransferase family 39 protein [uncultured Desulfuromonas sp.]